ncbi:hypothetical protein ACHAXT_012713 [Thalassiosira profunda]
MRELLRLLVSLLLSVASLVATVAVLLSAASALPVAAAEKIVIHKIQEAQHQFHLQEEAKEASPFLSATLKTEVTPVYDAINPEQLGLLSNALVGFLQKVFDDQHVYDVEVIGVAIFAEELVENAGDRRLALNSLQEQTNQFHPPEPDDDDGDDDGYAEEGYTLTFAAVVSAEHRMHQTLSHANFQTMLEHIFHKFESHLVDFVTSIEDDYFADVESVVVSGYEMTDAQQSAGYGKTDTDPDSHNSQQPESSENSVFVTVGLVVGILALSVMAIVAVRLRRRSKQLEANQWRIREMASNTAASSVIKSLSVLHPKSRQDNFSFDPVETNNGYSDRTSFDQVVAENTFFSPGTETIPRHPGFTTRVETVTFENDYRSNPLYQMEDEIPNPLSASKLPLEDVEQTQDVYAPPGKVGVAIDVIDGHPIVHKVKKGSPLEGLLLPNDRVVSIDGVDTTSMSAADVTQLMVRRMNYERKISFVRKEDEFC